MVVAFGTVHGCVSEGKLKELVLSPKFILESNSGCETLRQALSHLMCPNIYSSNFLSITVNSKLCCCCCFKIHLIQSLKKDKFIEYIVIFYLKDEFDFLLER